MGWLLFRHVNLLAALRSHARRHITLASCCCRSRLCSSGSGSGHAPGIVWPLAARGRGEPHGGPVGDLGLPQFWVWPIGLLAQLLLAITCSLIIWLLVLGVTGFFLRGNDRPNRFLRYLADASYWLYLVHFPLMIWTPILLAPLQAPVLIKLSLVLVITSGLMLAAYELLVRSTPLRAFVARATPAEP